MVTRAPCRHLNTSSNKKCLSSHLFPAVSLVPPLRNTSGGSGPLHNSRRHQDYPRKPMIRGSTTVVSLKRLRDTPWDCALSLRFLFRQEYLRKTAKSFQREDWSWAELKSQLLKEQRLLWAEKRVTLHRKRSHHKSKASPFVSKTLFSLLHPHIRVILQLGETFLSHRMILKNGENNHSSFEG